MMELKEQKGNYRWSKIKYWLQLWNGVWSVPLAFLLFILFGIFLQTCYDGGVGFYDPSFWQAALLSAGEFFFFNLVSYLTLYFCFRKLWRYFKGTKDVRGVVENKSKEDFENLNPWQKLVLLVFLYCFFITVLVSLYMIHV